MSGRLVPLRIYYFASFAALGAYAPFFPRWLEARGVVGVSMGLVAGLVPAMGVLGPPAVGVLADALRVRGSLLRVCSLGACLAMAALAAGGAGGPRALVRPHLRGRPRLRDLPLADGDARRRDRARALARRGRHLRRAPPLGLGRLPRRRLRRGARRRSAGRRRAPGHGGRAALRRARRRDPPPGPAGGRPPPCRRRGARPPPLALVRRLPGRLAARPDRALGLRPLLLAAPPRPARLGRRHRPRLGARRARRGRLHGLRRPPRREVLGAAAPRRRHPRSGGALGAPRRGAIRPRPAGAPAPARALVRAVVDRVARLPRRARARARRGDRAGAVHRGRGRGLGGRDGGVGGALRARRRRRRLRRRRRHRARSRVPRRRVGALVTRRRPPGDLRAPSGPRRYTERYTQPLRP